MGAFGNKLFPLQQICNATVPFDRAVYRVAANRKCVLPVPPRSIMLASRTYRVRVSKIDRVRKFRVLISNIPSCVWMLPKDFLDNIARIVWDRLRITKRFRSIVPLPNDTVCNRRPRMPPTASRLPFVGPIVVAAHSPGEWQKFGSDSVVGAGVNPWYVIYRGSS